MSVQSLSAKREHRAPARPASRGRRHEVVCSECGTPTTVPFRPTAGRPVYCRPCFHKRRGAPARVRPSTAVDIRPNDSPMADEPPTEDAFAVDGAFNDMALGAATRAAIGGIGITDPTPIQARCIPHLLAERDLIGQARTGSGKTLAFAVPIVERCDPSLRQVQAIVLVPTRELAIQVAAVTATLTASGSLRVQSLYGGRSIRPEHTALRRGPQIVIGTPGRTLDHLRQGNLKLSAVRLLVLDEADEMLDKGFARDVEAILERTPRERQTALFSATMPKWVANTAKKHLRAPETVEIDSHLQAPPSVEHIVYTIEKSDKMEALQRLLDERDGSIIVFGRTKHGVRKLARQLDSLGYRVAALQGNLRQNARERVLADFRSGAAPVLVATNVAARGLDVEGVDQVVNYDLPDSQQLFTHRVGRTGRMGRSGEAVTFVTPDEGRKWREIERGLGHRVVRESWKSREGRPRRTGQASAP